VRAAYVRNRSHFAATRATCSLSGRNITVLWTSGIDGRGKYPPLFCPPPLPSTPSPAWHYDSINTSRALLVHSLHNTIRHVYYDLINIIYIMYIMPTPIAIHNIHRYLRVQCSHFIRFAVLSIILVTINEYNSNNRVNNDSQYVCTVHNHRRVYEESKRNINQCTLCVPIYT